MLGHHLRHWATLNQHGFNALSMRQLIAFYSSVKRHIVHVPGHWESRDAFATFAIFANLPDKDDTQENAIYKTKMVMV